MFDPCAISVIPALMTNRTMQLALGAIEGSEPALAWKACVGSNLTYSVKDMVASMVPVYKELNARGGCGDKWGSGLKQGGVSKPGVQGAYDQRWV
jgi:hypothetical protein